MLGSPKFVDVGPLAALPLFRDLVCAHDAFEERAWPHRAANLEIAEVICEIKQPVDELDTGNILANVNPVSRGLLDPRHSTPSHHLPSEQAGIGALTFDSIKGPFGYRAVITDPFLQSGRFSGRAEKPLRAVNPETKYGALANTAPRAGVFLLAPAQPLPANDNDWPSEAEAA